MSPKRRAILGDSRQGRNKNSLPAIFIHKACKAWACQPRAPSTLALAIYVYDKILYHTCLGVRMRSSKITKGILRKGCAVQSRAYVEGASASLNLSAKELDDFLDGLSVRPTKSDLRNEYRSLLTEFARYWFHRGFRRGCIEAHRDWKDTGKFPNKVSYDARRDFFDGRKRPVKVSWKSKP